MPTTSSFCLREFAGNWESFLTTQTCKQPRPGNLDPSTPTSNKRVNGMPFSSLSGYICCNQYVSRHIRVLVCESKLERGTQVPTQCCWSISLE